MKKLIKKTILFISAILIFTIFVGSQESVLAGTSYEVKLSVKYDQTSARSMLKMINDFRTGKDAWAYDSAEKKVYYKNLGKLTYDYELEKIAMQRAAEIALYFAHTRPDNSECFTAFYQSGIGYNTGGENIAAGMGRYTTAASVFEGWQETKEKYAGQGHRRNMLESSFTAVGVAHVVYNGSHFWVQEFGSPNSGSAQTTALDKTKTVKVNVDPSLYSNITLKASSSSISMKVNDSATLPTISAELAELNKYDIFPYGTCKVTPTVKWSVSDDSVIKIEDGKVIALKGGTATIKAKALGKSKSITVTVDGTVTLKTITGVEAKSNGYNSVNISWTKATDKAGYKIYRATSKSGSYSLVKSIGTNDTTSYVDSDLTCGKTYYYKIRAYRTIDGKKVYSKSYSSVVSAKPVPAKVKISDITNGSSKAATLTWKKVSGASGYEVYRATSKSGSYSKVKTITSGSTVTYKNTSLTKGKTYFYKIRAYRTVSGKKVYGSYSSVKSITIKK